MLSGDLNVMLADAEGASSPSSSTDLSPPESEASELRSAARRMYLGATARRPPVPRLYVCSCLSPAITQHLTDVSISWQPPSFSTACGRCWTLTCCRS